MPESVLEEPLHLVHFYGREAELAESVGAFLADGLRDAGTAIVIAGPDHVRMFQAGLSEAGLDPDGAIRDERLIILDAEETLARLMNQGVPDEDRFDAVVGELVRQVARSGRPAVAYGEMVALLWERGDVQGALELETLWNRLLATVGFSLYCSYPTAILSDHHGQHLADVCALHSKVIGDPQPQLTAEAAASHKFPPTELSPRAARLFVTRTLSEWGHVSLVDDVAAVVTELATNALLHSGTEFTVSIARDQASVRLEVSDRSHRLPEPARPTIDITGGRGLLLVDALAVRWGAELTRDGKRVWAEFDGSGVVRMSSSESG